jgi:outer membrane lipoprotein-sorting protein
MILTSLVLLLGQSVGELVEKLRSESVEERDDAENQLRKLGKTNLPELEKLSRDRDPEVARRIQGILEPIRTEMGLEILQKLEDSIGKAKTVRVAWKYEGDGPPGDPARGRGSGLVLLQEGNRLRMELQMNFLGQDHKGTFISDGKRMSASLDGTPAIVYDPPKTLRTMVGLALVRGGGMLSLSRKEEQDPKTFMPVISARPGEDDGLDKTIFFTVRLQGGLETGEIKLWYDPKTGSPRKRTVLIKRGGQGNTTITETYQEYILDQAIPDEKFVIPGEVGKAKTYLMTDVPEPERFTLSSSIDVRTSGGILESGTLEFGGSGSLVELYSVYLEAMKGQGWTRTQEATSGEKATATLKKDNRTCQVEFSKKGDSIRAVIRVEPSK